MRVGLRRLRAGLAPFEKAFPNAGFEVFRAEAKRIASALGPARDQDIFGALVMEGPLSVFPRDQSFEALLSVSLGRRAQAYSAVRQLLTEPDTTCFVIDLESFVARRAWRNALDTEKLRKLTEPAPLFATEVLERLDRRARKRAKDLLRLGPPEERHLARIALKNLRYAADFFASLFDDGKGARQFMKCLGDLQNELGARNDEAVVAEMAGELEKEADVVAVRAAGIVLGWCTRGSEDTSAQLGMLGTHI